MRTTLPQNAGPCQAHATGNVRPQVPDEPTDRPSAAVRAFARIYNDLEGRITSAAINHYLWIKRRTRGCGLLRMTVKAIAEERCLCPGHVRRLHGELKRVGLIEQLYGQILVLDECLDGPKPRAKSAQSARDACPSVEGESARDSRVWRALSTPPLKKEEGEETLTSNAGVSPGPGAADPPSPRQATDGPRRPAPTDRQREAFRLVDLLRGRGIRFTRDGEAGWRWDRAAGIEPPGADERAELARLRPEVYELLDGRSPIVAPGRGSPAAGDQAAGSAPPIKPESRQAVGKRIGALDAGEASAADELAAALVDAFRDADRATSLATYRGIADDARRGHNGLSPGVISDAFEAACARNVRNRGAAFIAAIRRLKAAGRPAA